MNLCNALAPLAASQGGQPAIIQLEAGNADAISFKELRHAVSQAARSFADSGLGTGDKVLLMIPMSIDLYVTVLALFSVGAVPVLMDPGAGKAHLNACCKRLRLDAYVGTRKAHLLRLTSREIRSIPARWVTRGFLPGAKTLMSGSNEGLDPREMQADDPALITFTSGSTGVPKATVRSHGFLLLQHELLSEHAVHVAGEVDLVTLPVFVLANIASGLTSVIPDADLGSPGRIDGKKIIDQMVRTGTTRIEGSPAFAERILDAIDSGERPPALEKILLGGAPVFPDTLLRLRRAFPEAKIEAVYGSTEAEPISHIDMDRISLVDHEKMKSGAGLLVGNPVDEIELRVITDSWGSPIVPMTQAELDARTAEPETPGEIVVSGAHVMKGYLGGVGDEETKFKAAKRTWHRTGDAGYIDTEGRVWLLGRCGARISDEKGTLDPFRVETVVRAGGYADRSALVQVRGRRVLAIEARPDSEVDQEVLKDALAWAELDEIRVLDRIPLDRRHNAKIDYPALKQLFQASSPSA